MANNLVSCENLASMEEILAALLVKSASGDYGLRTVVTEVSEGTLEPGMPCGAPLLNPIDVLRRSLTLDSDSKPAIQLFVVT